MSLHIMYDHQCLKCEAYYIPYKEGIVCPNCGLDEKEPYDLISILANSAKYQMLTMGFYTPIAWWTDSFGDHVALIIFQILDAYDKQDGQDFQDVALQYCNSRSWGNQLYMKDHISDLSYKVFLELQAKVTPDKES